MKVLIAEDPQVADTMRLLLREVESQCHLNIEVIVAHDTNEAFRLLDSVDVAVIDFYGDREPLTTEANKRLIPTVVTHARLLRGKLIADSSLLRFISKPSVDMFSRLKDAMREFYKIVAYKRRTLVLAERLTGLCASQKTALN